MFTPKALLVCKGSKSGPFWAEYLWDYRVPPSISEVLENMADSLP
jgi:hypothetical protein